MSRYGSISSGWLLRCFRLTKCSLKIASKPVVRNIMERGFMERTLSLKGVLFLRKVKLKIWQILNV